MWEIIINGLSMLYKSVSLSTLPIEDSEIETILPLILGVAISCDAKTKMVGIITEQMSANEQEELQLVVETALKPNPDYFSYDLSQSSTSLQVDLLSQSAKGIERDKHSFASSIDTKQRLLAQLQQYD